MASRFLQLIETGARCELNQMPKIKPLQGYQLPLDEVLPDVRATPHKPAKKSYKISPLYRSKKPNV
ncbi:MAG: hypothetical protein LH702_31610 [Phormidesmis sp. CAN_BIN44]|nr:hypothetical protein [Phormidesmis sp. CAN_BIN44]